MLEGKETKKKERKEKKDKKEKEKDLAEESGHTPQGVENAAKESKGDDNDPEIGKTFVC